MSCADPIDTAVLADYWLGTVEGREEEAVEEHLFVCDACGDRLREVIALAEGVRRLARQGSLRMVVSDAFVRRAAEDGLRIREYAPPRGGSVQCTVRSEDDLLIARLAVDLSESARVDVSVCDESGVEQRRLRDIPVRPGASGITLQESITFAKAAPSHTLIMRLLAFDQAGRERTLGDYTFHHTRTLP
jgi:hypothetical protein